MSRSQAIRKNQNIAKNQLNCLLGFLHVSSTSLFEYMSNGGHHDFKDNEVGHRQEGQELLPYIIQGMQRTPK